MSGNIHPLFNKGQQDERKIARMDRIADAQAAQVLSKGEMRAAVADARHNGDTWAEIGQALGTSRQNATARFARWCEK